MKKKRIINIHNNNPINYSIHKLSDILNVERSTISRWIQNEKKCEIMENSKKLNLPGQGKKNSFYEHENDLINYFNVLRKENIAVNSFLLIEKMYSLSSDLKEKSYNSIRKLLYRILKTNNITLRRATHLGKPLPDH